MPCQIMRLCRYIAQRSVLPCHNTLRDANDMAYQKGDHEPCLMQAITKCASGVFGPQIVNTEKKGAKHAYGFASGERVNT